MVQVTGVVDHQDLIVNLGVVTETGTLEEAIVTGTLDEETGTGTGTSDEEIVTGTGNLEEGTETETLDEEVTVTVTVTSDVVMTVSAGVKTVTLDVVTVDSVAAWMMKGVDPQEQMKEVLGDHQDLLLPETGKQ